MAEKGPLKVPRSKTATCSLRTDRQTDKHTNTRMDTEYLSRLSLSSFCLWFERSNKFKYDTVDTVYAKAIWAWLKTSSDDDTKPAEIQTELTRVMHIFF